jgi:VWFA-related protein
LGNALRKGTTAALVLALALPAATAQSAGTQAAESAGGNQKATYTFKAESDLVLINVVARDPQGRPLRDLKATDFTVTEDGKAQSIGSFDYENVEAPAAGPDQAESQGAPVTLNLLTGKVAPTGLRDRRLLVLFFDFGSMEVDQAQNAIDAAQAFVQKQMTAADLVAVVTFSTSLAVVQDFTNDRAAIAQALRGLSATEGEGLQQSGASDQADTGAQFTADESEYNLFNTDLRLQAIGSLAKGMSALQQRKSVLYFSGGIGQTGADNQVQLRAAINAAVRSNVALYPVDVRGLEAMVPGGDATQGSMGGAGGYSGAAVNDEMDSKFGSQEAMFALASDTGGKAFFDDNDFGKALSTVLRDTATYYVIGYRTTNRALDGRYRHVSVKLNRAKVKLEYRAGYYGPRDFAHLSREDREQQLTTELMSDLPNTDLSLYLAASYFRMNAEKYFLALSLVVPGSAVPFAASGDKDKATLDVLGVVRERRSQMPVGSARDTIKLAAGASEQIRRKNIQYETGFLLPPGSYHLKFVVRENQTGRLGSFETDIVVPDLKKAPLKMSSVVLASQRGAKPKAPSPLPVLPNVAHVFSAQQPMYLYYEVYDPAQKPGVHLSTSIQFFSGKVRTYVTPRVEVRELNTPQRQAAAFEIEVPLDRLRPGWYTCQVNVIDSTGGTFAFPRIPLVIKPAATTPAAAEPTAVPGAVAP